MRSEGSDGCEEVVVEASTLLCQSEGTEYLTTGKALLSISDNGH